MKYEIGEYGLTLEKEPIHFLWYVDGSATGTIYDTYEDAVDAIKEKMRSDLESGDQESALKDGRLILYFTAGWEAQSIYMKIHISGSYGQEILDIVHAYDDRIVVEEI